MVDTEKGSPPPVRGKEDQRGGAVHVVGITPACAGKRKRLSQSLTREQDHPRLCGEKRTS